MVSSLTSKGICLALVALLLSVWLTAYPQQSYACSCAPHGTPLEELSASYAVFLGKVVSVRYDGSGDHPRFTGQTAKFGVETVWKGPVSETIYAEPSSYESSCGFSFAEGATYLVFAQDNFRVSACSRTKPHTYAVEDLIELGEGQVPESGTISPASYDPNGRIPIKNWDNPIPDESSSMDNRQQVPVESLVPSMSDTPDQAGVSEEPPTEHQGLPNPDGLASSDTNNGTSTENLALSVPDASASSNLDQQASIESQPDPTADAPTPSAPNEEGRAESQVSPTSRLLEERTNTGCGVAPRTTDVGIVGMMVGIALFGLRKRRV